MKGTRTPVKSPIGFIADTHIHPHKSHSEMIGSLNSRLVNTIDAILVAGRKLKDAGGRTLFIAGDVFHVRGSIKPSTINAFVNCLNILTEDLLLKVVIIPGNHDMEHLSGGDTSVDILNNIECVKVIGSPSSSKVDGWNVVAIPYQHKSEDFNNIIDSLPEDVEVIVAHQGIDDFKPYPAMTDTGVTVKGLTDSGLGSWVFSGHYHNSRISSTIVSIGSIVQNDFSSEGEDRGIWILQPNGTAQFHPIESPKFITINSGDKFKADDVDGNFIRVIAKNAKSAQKTLDALVAAGAKSVVTHIEREFAKAKADTIKISNPEEMVSKYIDIQSPKYDARKSAIMDIYRSLT